MTEQNSGIEPAVKQMERVILEQSQAMLPDAVEKFKNHDLDQLRQAMAENEAMRNALTIAVFTLANKYDHLAEEIRILTDAINRMSKSVEEMPDLLRNTMLTAVSKPAGGGKAN